MKNRSRNVPELSCHELNFAILSLPRSGSTALWRVMSLDRNVQIAYEPDFGDAWRQLDSFKSFCQSMNSTFQGIKHVWDPNGWPFVNKCHKSTLEALSQSSEWIGVNASLVNCVRKVLFLRRRNQLARIVSDLLGQQTNLWGHYPSSPHSDRETFNYKSQMEQRSLERLDERIIEWYLENAVTWEDQIIAKASPHAQLTVYYEDLFGADVEIGTRLARVVAVRNWLGLRARADDAAVQEIMHPKSKLNDASSYSRIPNLHEIVSKFGKI